MRNDLKRKWLDTRIREMRRDGYTTTEIAYFTSFKPCKIEHILTYRDRKTEPRCQYGDIRARLAFLKWHYWANRLGFGTELELWRVKYLVLKKTVFFLAEEFGFPKQSVINRLRKYGFPMRPRGGYNHVRKIKKRVAIPKPPEDSRVAKNSDEDEDYGIYSGPYVSGPKCPKCHVGTLAEGPAGFVCLGKHCGYSKRKEPEELDFSPIVTINRVRTTTHASKRPLFEFREEEWAGLKWSVK